MVQTRFRRPMYGRARGVITAWGLVLACAIAVHATDAIHTNQDVFYIPFTATTTASDSNAVGQVTLFASGDYGVSWHPYQSQSTGAGRFSFRAGADGEFWFAVRDAAITSVSSGTSPELRVVVDRSAPVVELQVTQAEPGTIRIAWSVDDDAAEEMPVRFEYRAESDVNGWHPIPLSLAPQRVGRHCEGQSTWVLPVASHLIIRATSIDRAGNRTVLERRVPMEQATNEATVSVNGNDPVDIPTLPGPHAMPSEKPLDLQLLPQAPAPPSQSAAAVDMTIPGPSQTPSPDQWHSTNEPTQLPRPDGILASLAPQQPGLPTSSIESGSPTTTPPSQPSEETHRLSRSRRFQMDYVIENGTPGGVHRIEAWFSSDGGRSWRHYGDDSDRQSPIDIEMTDDGTYGFRLLIQAREGLVAQPPRSGDVPDVWVTVDSLAPVARLTSARFGHASQAGQMTIHWEAHDQMLGDFPIALFFGETTNGPWRKIASELPNSGNFVWPLDDRVPNQFYLRLEATDRAGNIAVDVLQNPIRRDGFTPQGTIRGIRPIGYHGQ